MITRKAIAILREHDSPVRLGQLLIEIAKICMENDEGDRQRNCWTRRRVSLNALVIRDLGSRWMKIWKDCAHDHVHSLRFIGISRGDPGTV